VDGHIKLLAITPWINSYILPSNEVILR